MPVERPEENVELVVVKETRTSFGAENVAGILEANGIPALVEGQSLQEEFALSQRALGLTGCKVKIRKRDLGAARRILAEAEAAGEALEDDANDAGEAPPDPAP